MTLDERAKALAAAQSLDIYTDADWLLAYQDLCLSAELGTEPELSRPCNELAHLTTAQLREHIDAEAETILAEFRIVAEEARRGAHQ